MYSCIIVGGWVAITIHLLQPERTVCVSSKCFYLLLNIPSVVGMIQPSPNVPGMMCYINHSTKTK